mgnify:CR=1 FL=1
MIAKVLAKRLLEYPDADVMIPNIEDPTDFDFVSACEYFQESDRFHLKTPAVVERDFTSACNRLPAGSTMDLAAAIGALPVPAGLPSRITSIKYTMRKVRRKKR